MLIMTLTNIHLFTVFNMATGKPAKVLAQSIEQAKQFAIEKLGILSQYVCVVMESVYVTYASKHSYDEKAYCRYLDMITMRDYKDDDAFVAL